MNRALRDKGSFFILNRNICDYWYQQPIHSYDFFLIVCFVCNSFLFKLSRNFNNSGKSFFLYFITQNKDVIDVSLIFLKPFVFEIN